MTRLLPPPPPEVHGPLDHVLDQAVELGAPAPPWVAVEDDEGRWVKEVAAADPLERSHLVLAARSEKALVTAIRLGVGGALRLPPSTPSATAALEAAAAPAALWIPDDRLADLAGSPDGQPLAVGWRNRPFWRCQYGEAGMAARLAELAVELESLPAVASWPALVIDSRSPDEITAAWNLLAKRDGVVSEGLVIVPCEPLAPHCGLAAAAVRALVKGEVTADSEQVDGTGSQPVYELPSGRLMGWWGPGHPESPPDAGWFAAPEAVNASGYRWRLTGAEDEAELVDDVLLSSEVAPPAVRIPGWIAMGLVPGRPAALLLETLADAASRHGIPLWVPNVDQVALRLLLGHRGPIWVDGPAAPRADVESTGVRP